MIKKSIREKARKKSSWYRRVDRYFGMMMVLCGGQLFPLPGNAGLAYTVLENRHWQTYFQRSIDAEPQRIPLEGFSDQSAPALALEQERIAFEVQGRGIYVCALNEASQCRVIQPSRGYAVRPTWHPVINELMFVRFVVDSEGEESDVFLTENEMSASKPLVTQTGIQDYPDISRDGRSLAYTITQSISLRRASVQVIQQIWVMDLETGIAGQLMLSNAQDIQPDWSPDGERLAFASNRTGKFEIWVVNADGSGLLQVTSGPGSKKWPAWSPDGTSIMFTLANGGRQSLWLVDIDGSNGRPFQPFGADSNIQIRDAHWR